MSSLLDALRDARRRTHAVTADLDDEAWIGAPLRIANPIFWEVAHIAWFQERWILRHARRREPLMPNGDAFYDSSNVPHDRRWYLALPNRRRTLDYMSEILERSIAATLDGEHAYFTELAVYHEDMHGEALTYTRQTRGHPEGPFDASSAATALFAGAGEGPCAGDVEVPGGRFMLGARPDSTRFAFDNEKWSHPVDIKTFRIARAAVTNAEFAAFVDAGGYKNEAYWSDQGREFRQTTRAEMPAYWERRGGDWFARRFDRLEPLLPHRPVMHVSWFEADAYCRWAGRRLPTEPEWELAAASHERRTFPWGAPDATADFANVSVSARGPVDVAAYANGDSVYGCRQMIGNVWEWTASRFLPYPGFVADPYADYSAPWFEWPHMVLRGGSWATPGRMLRNTWRNFFPPDRRDLFAGFRTCAR